MSELALIDRFRPDTTNESALLVPGVAIRSLGALLALAVATAHVADQGGVTAFISPDWLGWAYRMIEVGGVLTALALLSSRTARIGWTAGVLLGVAPFIGYVISRTVGVPGDSVDVGNWDDWLGTVALFIEAALVVVSAAMVLAPEPNNFRPPNASRITGAKDGLTVADTWSLWLPMNLK